MSGMSPEALARELDQTAQRLEGACARGVERALEEVVMPAAIRWSSGPGQPPGTYARGGGGGGVDPGLINRRRGMFLASWERSAIAVAAGAVSGSVVNTASFAEFLARGTRTMVARPLPERVIVETEAEVRAVINEEVGKAVR